MPGRLLIVDDDAAIRFSLERYFSHREWEVFCAEAGAQAVDLCGAAFFHVVLLDLRLPDMDGLEVLEQIKTESPQTAVILITAYGDVATAVKAMQLRADNFVLKPIDLGTLHALVERLANLGRTQAEVHYLKDKLEQLAGSAKIDRLRFPPGVMRTIEVLAENPETNALILGETGTGKGVAANLIHGLSRRAKGQFVEVNCAGLSASFLESELFGHVQGAFTDAKTAKPGLFEVANRGTLFLDEIGNLAPEVQGKLLKVLEDKTFRRLGGTRSINVDVRILAATNADLEQAVRGGTFRPDLFFRLNVMSVMMPPLRERQAEIMPLARDFLASFTERSTRSIRGFSAAAEHLLERYSWPGNIRELRNIVERAVLLCEDDLVQPTHLPASLRGRQDPSLPNLEDDLSLAAAEKAHLGRVLALFDGNRSRASSALGIHRSTLREKIKKYCL